VRKSFLVYQAIAFAALLVTIYVATPPDPRWKVMLVAAIVAAFASLASALLHPTKHG